VEESDVVDDKVSKMTFGLGFHFNLNPQEKGGGGFDDGLSMASMKTGTSYATFTADNMAPDVVINVDNDHSDLSTSNSGHPSATGGNAATSAANTASV